jgi:chemotaxis protein MotB
MGAALEVRGNILTSLGKAFKDAGIEAEIDETTGEIAMDSKVLFAVNSYELSDEGKAYLDQFMKAYVPVLFSDEFKDSIAHVDFEGHTDSVGSFGFNMELSQNRADAVRDYCLESTENGLDENQKALLREKAVTRGFASTDLVYDENGTEDRDASRRVLVKFFITVK